MGLRAAAACSTAIHIGILALRPPGGLVPPRQTLYPLEVSYVILQEERPAPKVSPQPRRPQAQPAQQDRAADPPKPAPSKVEGREESPRRIEHPSRPVDSGPQPAIHPESRSGSGAGLPPGGPRAFAMPEGEFAAIRHKELVREHLRRELRYPETMLQGTVRLRITLLPDGRLKQAAVLEATDPRLSSSALQDARGAGPYPGFPKEMKAQDAQYEFLVQYLPDGVSSH